MSLWNVPSEITYLCFFLGLYNFWHLRLISDGGGRGESYVDRGRQGRERWICKRRWTRRLRELGKPQFLCKSRPGKSSSSILVGRGIYLGRRLLDLRVLWVFGMRESLASGKVTIESGHLVGSWVAGSPRKSALDWSTKCGVHDSDV